MSVYLSWCLAIEGDFVLVNHAQVLSASHLTKKQVPLARLYRFTWKRKDGVSTQLSWDLLCHFVLIVSHIEWDGS